MAGEELWSIPLATNSRDTPNSTTPVVVGDLVMCSMFRADAFCVRIKPDGSHEEVWQNRRSLETCYNPLTCVDGFVYGWHAFDRTFRCVELATGNVQWKERSVFERGNHIAIGDKFLILGELGPRWLRFVSPLPNTTLCSAQQNRLLMGRVTLRLHIRINDCTCETKNSWLAFLSPTLNSSGNKNLEICHCIHSRRVEPVQQYRRERFE